MSSFRKAHRAKRGEHRERAQPAKRAKLGILEKGKDWKVRRDDYHFKQKRLKALFEKARNKNPDEFYYAMVNAKTKGGRHVLEREGAQYSADEMKVLRTQDLTYVNMRRANERQKIEKLRANLHLLFEPAEDDGAGPAELDGLQNEHVVFVDSKREVAKFDPVKHFDTAPELVHRKFNRPTIATLKEQRVLAPTDGAELDKLDRKRAAGYTELEQRLVRLEQLDKLAGAMQTQRDLQGKGRRKKVTEGGEGKPLQYKWKKQRKR